MRAILIVLLAACANYKAGESIQGVFYFGHETSALVQCGSNEVWWVDGNTAAMKELNQLYAELVRQPYGNMYISAIGKLTEISGNADYVGTFEPAKVVNSSVDNKVILECVPNIEELK